VDYQSRPVAFPSGRFSFEETSSFVARRGASTKTTKRLISSSSLQAPDATMLSQTVPPLVCSQKEADDGTNSYAHEQANDPILDFSFQHVALSLAAAIGAPVIGITRQ
jgi:hypothetical protein